MLYIKGFLMSIVKWLYTLLKDVRIASSVFFDIRKLCMFSVVLVDVAPTPTKGLVKYKMHVMSRGVTNEFNKKITDSVFDCLASDETESAEDESDESDRNQGEGTEEDEATPKMGKGNDKVLPCEMLDR